MQRLVLEGTAKVGWEEIDEPVLAGPDAALVRPVAIATCDLDIAVLAGRYPLEGPYPFGHEGVVEVVAVGDEVTTVSAGDRVVVPFQISCGACEPCRRGRTGNCAAHPRLSTYGLGAMGGLEWGGHLADLVAVPHADAMLVKLPAGVDPLAVASASDNIPDGWRTVGPQLAAEPGAEVLVIGGDAGPSSIGLFAAGLAVALGASRVMYSRCCTLHTGRAHVRPAIPVVLDLVAAGFDPSLVTSAVVARADAVDVLAHPPMKLVIDCAS